MVAVKIQFAGERMGPKFERRTARDGKLVRQSVRDSANVAAKRIEALGSLDIAKAPGKFGTRWTTGLHATVSEGGGNVRILVTHRVSYFMVFERGAVIHGRPLLAIPLSFAPDAQGVLARNFPGGLFRVNRKAGGAPLLFSISDRKPKYFLKESVKIPKKFHITEIARTVARDLKNIYSAHLKALKQQAA